VGDAEEVGWVARDAALLWVGRAWSLGRHLGRGVAQAVLEGVLVLVEIDVSQLLHWRYCIAGLERQNKSLAGASRLVGTAVRDNL
jgi:hypothetical protein